MTLTVVSKNNITTMKDVKKVQLLHGETDVEIYVEDEMVLGTGILNGIQLFAELSTKIGSDIHYCITQSGDNDGYKIGTYSVDKILGSVK